MGNNIRDDFLIAMGHVACTVNVITTNGPAGRFGVTVSAMSSVSADGPSPTLLVCVHVLRADQAYVSDHFSGRIKSDNKFLCADWEDFMSGVPRLANPLAAFDCAVTMTHRIGTHHVFFGIVNAVYFGVGLCLKSGDLYLG